MEFIIIFALVFFVFVLLVALIIGYSQEQVAHDQEKRLQNIAKLVSDSIIIAYSSGTDFQMEIVLPESVDGTTYNAAIIDKDTLVLSSGGATTQTKLPQVEGSINIGCNRITKHMGVVTIAAC